MNIDDLHDPSPPRADSATLAAVASRARTLRRRRAAFTTVGGALALALVAVPVGLALREEDVDRMAPATLPTVEATPSVTPTSSSVPSSSTSVPPSSPVDAAEPIITAVTEGGEMVAIADDGTSTVLKMTDPPLPGGAEVRTVLMGSSRRAFVGICCLTVGSGEEEPARWGEFLAGALDRPGQLRSMAADGSAVAVVRSGGVALFDVEGLETASGRPEGSTTVVDVAFLPDGRIAVIDLATDEDAGFVGRLHVTDDELSTLATSAGTFLGPVQGNGTWQLAGTDAGGNVLVVAGGDGALEGQPRGFDPDTLVETERPATPAAEAVRDVWFDAGVAIWVDVEGRLWHDSSVLAEGPYRSARPVTSGSLDAPTEPTTAPTTTASVPTATAGPGATGGFTAIRADGDAEHVIPGEPAAAIHDGADPRDAPAGGGTATVDSFLWTAGAYFVSTCCDPISGTWTKLPVSDMDEPFAAPRPGHGVAVSPDEERLAVVGWFGVQVADPDGNVLTTISAGDGTVRPEPQGVMWVDEGTVAVITSVSGEAGATLEFRLLVGPPEELDLIGSPSTLILSIDPNRDEYSAPVLTGVAVDGAVLVDGEAYDPVTLARRPGSDVALPQGALDVWVDRGVMTHVDADGVLWHDGVRIADGPYTWARPVAAG